MSNDLIISIFLPILIYLNTGTNFSVGVYSSIASLIAGLIVLYLRRYFAKKKFLIMWISTVLQVCVSLFILVFSSIYIFFVYFFVIKTTKPILQNGINSSMFNLPKYSGMKKNLIEHFCAYNLVNFGSVIIILIVGLIVYNLINNIVAIIVILAMASLLQIVSTIFAVLGDTDLNKNMMPI